MRTPWGKADFVTEIIPGMFRVNAPGHGGIKLSRKLQARMPEYMKEDGGWYEEDSDYAKVFVVFAKEIAEKASGTGMINQERLNLAQNVLRNWKPDAYEKFYNTVIPEGKSYLKDQRAFAVKHANDLQAVYASMVSKDMVRVGACIGGRNERGHYNGDVRTFLVPATEYDARGRFSFVVDPTRHMEIV